MIRNTHIGGMSLIEILVALLVTLIGILGFIGLQARSQQADLESFQREQALRIIDFMVNQINTNRAAAGCYGLNKASVAYVGSGYASTYTCNAYGTLETQTQVAADIAEWDSMLKGASETLGGTNVGSMIGARGCITYDDVNNRFTVSVAWQGMMPSAIPTDTCGQNLYGDENLRRAMAITIDFADLK